MPKTTTAESRCLSSCTQLLQSLESHKLPAPNLIPNSLWIWGVCRAEGTHHLPPVECRLLVTHFRLLTFPFLSATHLLKAQALDVEGVTILAAICPRKVTPRQIDDLRKMKKTTDSYWGLQRLDMKAHCSLTNTRVPLWESPWVCIHRLSY